MTTPPDAALPKDRRGALYGLLGAALFGLSAPVEEAASVVGLDTSTLLFSGSSPKPGSGRI